MCGIVGYTGTRAAGQVLIEGLKKLEYRGYDSAGVAFHENGQLIVTKAAGSVADLETLLEDKHETYRAGLGHTRWATHGPPTNLNAHPHSSASGEIVVVHNGIIENHRLLRKRLSEEAGITFRSETDSEVLAHLIEYYYDGDLLKTVRRAMSEVEGSYALVVACSKKPDLLVCARQDSPLIIGLGEGENYVASDIPALLAHTRKTCIMEDGEFASITPAQVQLFNKEGLPVEKEIFEITWDQEAAEKGGYDHFMLKEIMEQPEAARETLRQRVDLEAGKVDLAELGFSAQELSGIEKILIIACGTAYHAGLIGKMAIETIAGIPVEVDVASEFRYRNPLINPAQLAIVISQSGETADTLAGLRLARSKGLKVLAITNVVGSTVSREADRVLYTWAGPEIAVASTKAYVTQLIALYLFAIYFGQIQGAVGPGQAKALVEGLLSIPGQLKQVLSENNRAEIKNYCEHLVKWDNAFFIGRNLDYPVAMEGALKLKEISYIHAEACAAGELKHGPLALIEEGLPVVALATQEAILDKTMSNVQVVNARGGAVFAITREDFDDVSRQVESVFYLPATIDILFPILSVVPTQLIAYYTAVARGCSVDKPRNLAKSVTVE